MWKVVKQVPVRPLILIGAGNLGTNLCSNYNEFEGKGLKIVAAFDHDPRKCGTELGHIKTVQHVSDIKRITKEYGAKIAILAIPADKAQEITKMCIDAGISTILNYSPVSLNVPNYVHVEYMDPALKIQMALFQRSNTRSHYHRSISSTPRPLGLHFSPFPAYIGQSVTPLLAPFQKYFNFRGISCVMPSRSYSTYSRSSSTSFLHSNRYATDFEEVGMLGRGGFGSVYQAHNRMDGMDYAVKKVGININSGSLNDITDHKYLREVRAMARLNHHNLVRYYYAWMELEQGNLTQESNTMAVSCSGNEDLSAYGGTNEVTSESYDSASEASSCLDVPCNGDDHLKVILYIQMELCMGFTLKEWLARPERVVHIQECHTILNQILQGLHHIHAHGFIHRDVTPPNIFLESFSGQIVAKIGDFGLAKHCGDIKTDQEVFTTLGNDKTMGVGTFLYASPEQLSNAVYDTKADMYSVGVIFCELLQPFNTQMERVMFLTQLKEGSIPAQVSVKYPFESGMIELLVSRDSTLRPSAEQMLARVKNMLQ